MKIEILGWEELNPPSVVRTPFWFRVNIDISNSEALFGLKSETKWVWICLLSEAMKKRSGTFELNLLWAANTWEIKISDLKFSVQALETKGLLRCDSTSAQHACNIDVELQNRTEQTEQNTAEPKFRTDLNKSSSTVIEPLINYFVLFKSIKEKVSIPVSAQKTWLDLYGDKDWIDREFLKMAAWCEANPNKRPKSQWVRFINGWLSRGWEKNRLSLPGEKQMKSVSFE